MQTKAETCRADVAQIVGEVFDTMLSLEAEPAADEFCPVAPWLTAAVFLVGAWQGAVMVECDEPQARLWTSRLMAVEQPDASDVADAMGELVNMISGNLKSVLVGGVSLSMPVVVTGQRYAVKVCGGNLISRQCFRSAGEHFRVTLVEVEKQ